MIQSLNTSTALLSKVTNSLLKNSVCVLRQAQHERENSVFSITTPFILRLSKDEWRVFQQTANSSFCL